LISRLRRIDPVQFALVSAVIYAVLALIMAVPAMFFMMSMASISKEAMPMFFTGPLMIVVLPVMYGVFGFIGGIIFAALYNLVAGWTGGVEITLENVAAPVAAV
jgi:hypothetical protein